MKGRYIRQTYKREHRPLDYQVFDDKHIDIVKQISKVDTLLYELDIESYRSGDQIIKMNGFVDNKYNNSFYKKSYYKLDISLVKKLYLQHPSLKIDLESIEAFSRKLDSLSMNRENEKNKISPYCGINYLPINLNFNAVYIGHKFQIIPVELDCAKYKIYKKHKGRNYKIKRIPVYIITKVLNN
ncbi:hypothetical protein MUN84_18825 [Hymenobacter sp. 5516J-16]|uniref:hypothetical protein n=1 Tax=Hymenobacter sp. 5516J-16 TaxID=2932253 RepID=UPI001FD1AC18|nr:hypothetical protein [Hymenobacter sp. 5516J-16]UOQ76565.1 hypothetical protein MUN84_18825 [Hymenobacter sp. 5516J-16]